MSEEDNSGDDEDFIAGDNNKDVKGKRKKKCNDVQQNPRLSH